MSLNDPINRIVKICPKCKTENSVATRHCTKCDENLVGVMATPSNPLSSAIPLPALAKTNEPVEQSEEQTTAVLQPQAIAVPLPTLIAAEDLVKQPEKQTTTEQLPIPVITDGPTGQPAPTPRTFNSGRFPRTASLRERFTPKMDTQRRRVFAVLALFVIILIIVLPIIVFHFLSGSTNGNNHPGAKGTATSATLPSVPNGLGEFKASNGELLGINDGSSAPFLQGADGQLKQQAANALKQGHRDQAVADWQHALHIMNAKANTNNDAEAWVYLEDQLTSISASPYKTLVVGTDLFDPSGLSDLQGVYVAQHEFNEGNHGFRLRILIANSGTDPENASAIAQQIVHVANQDKTVIGVVSWLTSSENLNAIPILAAAHIPMISPTASSDKLTDISSFFFRIAPPNRLEGRASALFAEQTLHAQKVVVFVDNNEPYSENLAQDFETQFKQDKHVILKLEPFVTDHTHKIGNLISDALSTRPDLLYFACRDTSDATNFEDALPTSGLFAHIPALAGDGAYVIHKAGYGRWYFASFAFPNELSNVTGNPSARSPFYQDYSNAFNQDGLKPGGYYGYTRSDNNAMLSYDVTSVFLIAIEMTLGDNKTIATTAELQSITPLALTDTLSRVVLQGVSGYIAFDATHDPINKAFVFLGVSPDGHTYMKDWEGCFTPTLCRNVS